ncbi:hypothetical protein F4861DRAFT_512520 [Xylaria intraflava]|nr:hypothetical protein F4861DRAFT_512520 [Xylaria intraflava]
MSKQKHAIEFEKIIHEGRERKRNEQLAARIFSKNGQRKADATPKPGHGGSLASRVGVKKRAPTGPRIPAGNINGDWTHDLHSTQNGRRSATQQPAPNSLAARVHPVGTTLPKTRPTATRKRPDRKNKLANAISRTAAAPANSQQQMNLVESQDKNGFTIKGLAGPFAVLAQNFAPGTTAADIESALTPIGGLIVSCRLVKTHPIVIAEIVFESKEGADQVIRRFDQQTADGRLLSVYMKPGGYTPPPKASRSHETRLRDNSVLIDGSMGFGDPVDADDADRGLYSDRLVSASQTGGGNATYRIDRGTWQGW